MFPIFCIDKKSKNEVSCHICHHFQIAKQLIYNTIRVNVKMTATNIKTKFVKIDTFPSQF